MSLPRLDWVRGFSCVNDVLQRLDRASAERAILRSILVRNDANDAIDLVQL
jgi:hypothetical protein